jgi:hypothetical protein
MQTNKGGKQMKTYLYAIEWRGRLNVESMRVGSWSYVLDCCRALRAEDKKLHKGHWPYMDPIKRGMYRVYEFDDDSKPRLCNKDVLAALGPAT